MSTEREASAVLCLVVFLRILVDTQDAKLVVVTVDHRVSVNFIASQVVIPDVSMAWLLHFVGLRQLSPRQQFRK